ncbi:hypothetical protein [uncultured Kiloniella sp.]|uniref:hypothetical protein n=1 Tax=uncultured Kiloniella sp. TaxID=1133091 RepID=UPI00261FBFA8|nr:hypothetical protein [uncultured Kiloniella sp.]
MNNNEYDESAIRNHWWRTHGVYQEGAVNSVEAERLAWEEVPLKTKQEWTQKYKASLDVIGIPDEQGVFTIEVKSNDYSQKTLESMLNNGWSISTHIPLGPSALVILYKDGTKCRSFT